MNKFIGKDLVAELRRLHGESESARALFNWAAARTNDAGETSIERLMRVTHSSRSALIELARELGEIGCGEFILGRKGWKSRIRWSYSLRSLGQAAQGQTSELVEIDPEVAEDAVDQLPPPVADGTGERGLTIADAKRGLAATFGVSPEAIDIVIRG